MRRTGRTLTTSAAAGAAAAAVLVGLSPTAGATAPRYVATDVPVYGTVVGIDHRGDVLVSTQNGAPEGFLVRKGGQPVQLRATDGTSEYVEVAALDDQGVSVGSARNTDLHRYPVRWSPTGVPTRLASLPGDDPDGVPPVAVDIDNHGVVLGNDGAAIVEWTSPSTPRVVLAGTSSSGAAVARAFNDRGVIAGRVGNHAALIDADGSVRPLGRLAGERYSDAVDVNDSGVAVGSVTTAGGTFPVLWDADGTVHRLGGASARANAIGDDGTVVGTVYNATTTTTRGYARILTGPLTYLPPGTGGTGGTSAFAVNDRGVVGGETDVPHTATATVWTRAS